MSIAWNASVQDTSPLLRAGRSVTLSELITLACFVFCFDLVGKIFILATILLIGQ